MHISSLLSLKEKSRAAFGSWNIICSSELACTMSPDPLQELILSSTYAASPVPTTTLHNVQTGASVMSFKTPNSSTTTTATAAADSTDTADGTYRTMSLCVAQRGLGGVFAAIGGKQGRAGLNVWNFNKVGLEKLVGYILEYHENGTDS